MAVLAEEYQRGRIRSLGVSNYSAVQMRQAQDLLAKANVPLAVNQVQYSLLARQIETNGVLKTAQDLGITLLAYSPLAQGLVTGKYNAATYTPPKGARKLDPRFSQRGLERLDPLLNLLKELGDRHQATPAQVALQWLIAQGTVPIPGAKTPSQAVQNAGALAIALSPEERIALGEIATRVL
jgi:aryl-alcohol dehydrogenase-like predicted oxidoreductase